MNDDLGSPANPVKGDSETGDNLNDFRADLSMNINGHRIEAVRFDTGLYVTVDGKEFKGSFSDAIKSCTTLPIRWNGLFD